MDETYDEDELRELMEEPWGDGPYYGRRASNNPEGHRRHVELNTEQLQARHFLRDGDWTIQHVKHGGASTGMTGHRGALYPGEYLDRRALARAAGETLGADVGTLREVYGDRGGGPLPRRLRPVRDAIDRELAGVEDVSLLARVLGAPKLAPALRRGRARGLRALRL